MGLGSHGRALEVVLVSGWKKVHNTLYRIDMGDYDIRADVKSQTVLLVHIDIPTWVHAFSESQAEVMAKRLIQAAGLARGDFDLDDIFLAENKEET